VGEGAAWDLGELVRSARVDYYDTRGGWGWGWGWGWRGRAPQLAVFFGLGPPGRVVPRGLKMACSEQHSPIARSSEGDTLWTCGADLSLVRAEVFSPMAIRGVARDK